MEGYLKEYPLRLENLANQPGLTTLISELILSSSRGATKVVAADDSLEHSKQAADYVCDGIDDQVQIQAAIDSLPACGGKIVLLEGHFNISAYINLISNIDFEGSGEGTLLYLVDASNDHVIYGSNLTKLSVRNLHINSNSANQTSPPAPYKGCIFFRDVTHFKISDVNAEYAPGHCIDIGDGCSDGIISKATTSYAYDDGIAISGTATGIAVPDCISHHNGLSLIGVGSGIEIDDGANLVTVTGCVLHDNEAGISVHTHAGYLESHDIAIDGNLIYNNTSAGIQMQGWDEPGGEILFNFLISGNVLRNNGGIGIDIRQIHNGIVQGNTIYDQAGDGIYAQSSKYLTITDNGIYNPGAVGISVSGFEHSLLTNNNIYSPGTRGVLTTNTVHSIIDGNNVHDSVTEGIKITGDQCTIVNNMVYSSGDNGFELNISNSKILGNTADGSALVGFYFHQTVEQLIISNNMAINNGTHGVQLAASVSTKNILFSGNSCLNNNQVVGSNYGFIAHSASNFTIIDNDFSDYQAVPTQKIGAYLSYITSGLICKNNRATGNTDHQIIGAGGVDYNKYSDPFTNVLAVSATHAVNAQACHADPTTLTVGAGIAAQPDVPRTLSWTVNNAGGITAADISIKGVDAKGNDITESFDLTGGLTGETNNAFATVSEVKIENQVNAAAGDTISVGITDVLGLSNIISATGDIYKIKKNNADAVVAAAQVNITYDTYDMAVIGLAGTDDFIIWYKTNLNIIT
ncbi:MAG: right-handed parallel beta-helix repeat-containing protein [Halobacteriota archaeon]